MGPGCTTGDVDHATQAFGQAAENADLLWALRGGGGNFGVVTSFSFRTNPVSMVYGGPIVFELADAPAVMKWFRQFQPKAPEDAPFGIISTTGVAGLTLSVSEAVTKLPSARTTSASMRLSTASPYCRLR